MKKSKKLKIGDTIAVLSPSWGGPNSFPDTFDLGLKILTNFGLKIKEYPSTRKSPMFLRKNPKFRANDINSAFEDKEVKAIFVSIGGDDSVKILPFIDIKVIKNNPKIIIGYSDTSTLLTYLNQIEIVTLHGPSIMAGFAQYNNLGTNFQTHIKQILFENPDNFSYQAYSYYCEGYSNWSNKSNLGGINDMSLNKGWNFLRGKGKVEGQLFGGCIETLESMKNTSFWPNFNFWNNKIFFLENSEDKTPLNEITKILEDYENQGVFNQISALLIGRARDYNIKEKKQLDEIILSTIKNKELTIISNMDFGHTDPQWILPLGIKAQINHFTKSFQLIERIFKD